VIPAWDSSGNSLILSLDSRYTQYQDGSGTLYPITGNQGTLTNAPIFILSP
jgi:hypothetical protein